MLMLFSESCDAAGEYPLLRFRKHSKPRYGVTLSTAFMFGWNRQ
jgi:hypothetical protein